MRRTLAARLRAYPAVGLVGPRQCGKTTLARSLKVYLDLEQPGDRLRAELEAHPWPDVFSRLRGLIDTASPSPEDFARLNHASDLAGAERRFLVSRTATPAGGDQVASHNLASMLKQLRRAR